MRLLKIFFKILKYLFFLIVFIAILPYLTCPVYKYPQSHVFSGSKFYNPYEKLDTSKWLKANFHAHSRVWWGLTYGWDSDPEELVKKYRELNYDVVGISEYQLFNPLSDIPVYEHGTGIFKNHQLSIGAKSILWKEYLFFQNFHHKQDIISGLREGNNLISINHPPMRGAYDEYDMKTLTGFDLLEVINHNYSKTLNLWDTVLSNGNPVFLIVNDDSHNITNPKDFGYAFTLVNSNTSKTEDIIDALRKGNAVGVEMEPIGDFSAKVKLQQAVLAPKPVSLQITGDSIVINFDKSCDTIKLIGQNGTLLLNFVSSKYISYKIKPEDSYIRAEVNQNDLTNVILNPVFRYDGQITRPEPVINHFMTWLFRSVLILLISTVIFLIIKRKRRHQLSGNS